MAGKIKLRVGDSLHLSEKGYYNFVYPSKKTVNIINEEEVEIINWIKFEDKLPVRVLSSNVSGADTDEDYIVLWKDL